MSDDKKSKTKALLGELESIKSLLDESELEDVLIDDELLEPPILTATVDDDEALILTEALDMDIFDLDAIGNVDTRGEPTSTKPEPSPQPSLFDSPGDVEAPETTPNKETTPVNNPTAIPAEEKLAPTTIYESTKTPETTKAKGENPFLPNHIRARLHTTRSLQEELSTISALTNELIEKAKTKNLGDNSPTDSLTTQQLLIDELVNAYLPVIEMDLRRRLQESLKKNPIPNPGIVDNDCPVENYGLVQKYGLVENNGLVQNNGLIENDLDNNIDDSTSDDKALSEDPC